MKRFLPIEKAVNMLDCTKRIDENGVSLCELDRKREYAKACVRHADFARISGSNVRRHENSWPHQSR